MGVAAFPILSSSAVKSMTEFAALFVFNARTGAVAAEGATRFAATGEEVFLVCRACVNSGAAFVVKDVVLTVIGCLTGDV